MASSCLKYALAAFAFCVFMNAALGEIICDDLPKEVCAFSVAATGKRCILETYAGKDGVTEYQCRTSEVVVRRIADYIESDECVEACGVDRNTIGISSDALLEPQFTAKLCSSICYRRCPNIIDLYFHLVAGEGAFLPELCEASGRNPHRSMMELMSNGDALSPVSSPVAGEPTMAPASAPGV